MHGRSCHGRFTSWLLSVLIKKTKGGLVIILTGSDETSILATKTYLQQHLSIRDLGSPTYFLGIKFAHQDRKLALTQRKYALDLLKETRLLGCQPKTSPMEALPQLWDTSSPLFEDANRYQRLLGKLIYLTVTHHDIVYTVSVLSQFMHEPRHVH